MKHRQKFLWKSLCFVLLLVQFPQLGYAQTEGFITPLSPNTSSFLQEVLPPGAVYEGTQVHHVIAPQENLHILAAYYYGNPRQWQQIYRENQSVIRNVNRLPVGKTLRITVGESWRPMFSYQEWLQLAHRNGLWQPGQWRRAAATAGQTTVPSREGKPSKEERPEVPASPVEQTSPAEVLPPPKTPPVVEEPPVVEPPAAEEPPTVEEPPAAEQAPQETPTEEPAAEQAPQETPTEEPEAEQAPAF